MYSKEIEELIDAALADGVLTEKEKQILLKKAKAQGIDLDEFEMVLNARLLKVQQPQSARPARTKLGNIVACPNCGAVVQAYMAKCPECGYEFENVKANLSIDRLAETLKNKNYKQQADIIRNFPIPNTKTDLLDFMTATKPKFLHPISTKKSDNASAVMTAYMNKYHECLLKAQVIFPNDSSIISFMESWPQDKKQAKKQIWKQGDHENFWFSVFFIGFFVLVLGGGVIAAISEENEAAGIDTQYERLLDQINALPIPTKYNCDSCAYEIQKIDWQVLFSSGWEAEDEMTKRKAFYERKNAYIDLLQKQGVRIEKVEVPKEPEPSLLDRLF